MKIRLWDPGRSGDTVWSWHNVNSTGRRWEKSIPKRKIPCNVQILARSCRTYLQPGLAVQAEAEVSCHCQQ